MHTKHSVFKKTLSVLLAVVMAAGVLGAGLSFPALVARAAESRSAALPMGDLTFIVPEAIYLYPNGSSWTAATSSPFQYYVNNDANNAPVTAAGTTGKIYYNYAYTFDQVNYGAQTAVISYQFVDGSFRSLSGGSVTLSSSTISSGGSVDITAGQSPSLAASANGCYILWTLTLTDAADSKVKRAYAITYVYKPYVAPVGVFVETFNKYANDSHANQITWISGVHSITQQTVSTHDGNYYPNYSGDYGMAGFITAGDTAYVGGTSYNTALGLAQNNTWTASASGATRYKLAFKNAPASAAHFNDTDGHDNEAATSWGSTSSSGSTFNVSSFDYWYKTVNPALWGRQALAAVYATPYGNISIDTSRYSDLSQIPNLAVGLMATNNEQATRSSWYVADYSTGSRQLGYEGTHTDDSNSDSEKETYFNDYSYIIAGQGTAGWNNFGDDYTAEGVKYAGAWPRSLQNVPAPTANDENSAHYESSYNYAVKGAFTSADKGSIDNTDNMDYCFAYGTVRLTARQYNKSTLRAAVQRAISEMPSLGVNGISNGNITSMYFDANASYKWTALQAAFKNAVLCLTTLDSNSNPNDLAKALNTALDELCTKVTVDANGGSFTSLNTVEYAKIGDQIPSTNGFRYTPTYSGPSKDYYSFQGWSGNPDTHSGLSYVRIGYNGVAYATWKPIDYTMTLLPADDDNVNTETKTATYNIETDGIMSDIFAEEGNDLQGFPAPRQGYSFWYWEVVSADEGSNWTVGEKFHTADRIQERHGNVTLKAYWAEGMVDVYVYNYEMNMNGSYLNATNQLVPADTYLTYGTTNQIVRLDTPNPRAGFTVDRQKSRLVGTAAANGSTILKVFYARNQYDVTFVDEDGTNVLQAAKPFYHGAAPAYTGTTPRKAPTPGKTYAFSGWNDGVRTYTPAELAEYELTGPVTFTAEYSETELLYTVTSAAGTGTEITVDEGSYTYGAVITVSAAALEGYVAAGLKLYANGEEIENPCTYTVTADVEFTTDALDLKPSYLVTFYTWDENKIATVSVSEGSDASGLVGVPEREGYTFAHWSLPVNNVTENMTVIAQYNKDGATNYTFNFCQDAKLLATLVREADETFDFPYDILGTPAKSGFDFMGWDKTFSPAAENLDVYAVFQPNGFVESYTLTVVYGNGTANGSFTQESGTMLTVNYPERAGYVFTGWTGDTENLSGTTYIFGDSDETITAAWYDLTDLNAAETGINGILAESELYRSDYVARLNGLLTEKTDLTAAVPASAAALDDLLSRMLAAIDDAPDYLLYTLFVNVDGSTVETLKEIAGATVTINTAPEKSGFSFNGWVLAEGSGTLSGNTYTFAADNAVVNATWVVSNDSIAALRARIEALSADVYCQEYLEELFADLEALEAAYLADPGDIDGIAGMIQDLTDKLAEKDQHKHKFTVFVDYDAENPPTCTKSGYAVYECENCAGRTKKIAVSNLGHDWGEWEVLQEATYGVDGEAKRTCNRCGEEETVVLSLNDQSDKAIRFVTMNNMYYTLDVGDGVYITTVTTYRWFSSQELRFKVTLRSGFGFADYIVYLNGEPITPDGDGYYTVPADPDLATVSISGVMNNLPVPGDEGSSSSGKTSFWQWLVNFFHTISEFFHRVFGG